MTKSKRTKKTKAVAPNTSPLRVPTAAEIEAAVDNEVLDALGGWVAGDSVLDVLKSIHGLIETGIDTLPVVPRWTKQNVQASIGRLIKRGLAQIVESVVPSRRGNAQLTRAVLNSDGASLYGGRSPAKLLAHGKAVRWTGRESKWL